MKTLMLTSCGEPIPLRFVLTPLPTGMKIYFFKQLKLPESDNWTPLAVIVRKEKRLSIFNDIATYDSSILLSQQCREVESLYKLLEVDKETIPEGIITGWEYKWIYP